MPQLQAYLTQRQRTLAVQRDGRLAQQGQRVCAGARSRATSTGASRCLCRAGKTSGCTSGSRPSWATSRPASSGRATSASPTPGKQWWYNPAAKIYNFIGKDNIAFHTIIWPAELIGVDGIYNDGRRCTAQPALRRARQRVHEHRGQEVQQEPQLGGLAAGHPDTLRSRRDALLRRRDLPGNRKDADFRWAEFVSATTMS